MYLWQNLRTVAVLPHQHTSQEHRDVPIAPTEPYFTRQLHQLLITRLIWSPTPADITHVPHLRVRVQEADSGVRDGEHDAGHLPQLTRGALQLLDGLAGRLCAAHLLHQGRAQVLGDVSEGSSEGKLSTTQGFLFSSIVFHFLPHVMLTIGGRLACRILCLCLGQWFSYQK